MFMLALSVWPTLFTVIGDLLTLSSSLLLALSNLGQEYVVKNYSRVEFLFMMGGFGSLISLIQFLSLELKSLDAVTSATGGYWFGYTASMLISYSVVPIMLEQSSAVVMNVSFLTSGACFSAPCV